jgi:hypothetical protein
MVTGSPSGQSEHMTVTRRFPQPVVIRNDQASVDRLLGKACGIAWEIESGYRADGWRLWRSGTSRLSSLTTIELMTAFLGEVVNPCGTGHRLDVLVERKKKRWTVYAVTVVLVRG